MRFGMTGIANDNFVLGSLVQWIAVPVMNKD